MRRTLFPPLDKRNTRDKAKGLRITSVRYIVRLSVRCLSIINRGRDLRQEAPYSGCFYGLVEREFLSGGKAMAGSRVVSLGGGLAKD